MTDSENAPPAKGSYSAESDGSGRWFVMTEDGIIGRKVDVAEVCSTNGYGEREARLFAASPALLMALRGLILAINSDHPDAADMVAEAERVAGEVLEKAVAP